MTAAAQGRDGGRALEPRPQQHHVDLLGLPDDDRTATLRYQLLHRAASALLEAGRFGRCEACGGAIEAERLDALPYATLCLADARARARPR